MFVIKKAIASFSRVSVTLRKFSANSQRGVRPNREEILIEVEKTSFRLPRFAINSKRSQVARVAIVAFGAGLCLNAQSGFAPIRINAGGQAYTDSAGTFWAADYGFTGIGSYAISTTTTIANTNQGTMYQTARANCGNALTYSLAVPNGSYNVTLKWAEIYYATGGTVRQIAPSVNNLSLTAFPLNAPNSFTPVDKTFLVTVTNGLLSISVNSPNTGCPTLNGIEVLARPQLTSADVSGLPTNSFNEVLAGVLDGVNATFTLSHTPIVLLIFRNGVLQEPSLDYTVSGASVTFTAPPSSDDILLATYQY